MTKKKKISEQELEEMRKRALQPFKPSITDEDVREFEERIRQRSLEQMKLQKEELNEYDKQRIKDKVDFIHHL